MVKRSETEDNLEKISNRAENPRMPLSSDFYNSDLSSLPSSTEVTGLAEEKVHLDEIRQLDESKEASDLRRRKVEPRKVVSDDKLRSLDHKQIESIFLTLNSVYHQRLERNKRKGNIFKSSFADLSADSTQYTILDSPQVKDSQFYGFFILFWLATAFFILKDALHAILEDGLFIYKAPVFKIFVAGLPKIAFTDALMYLSIFFAYFVQNLCLNGHITWKGAGWIIMSVYELGFFIFWIGYLLFFDFQWIGRVFLVLHMFVLLMKMHSYAFYNGYLWQILLELQFSEQYLTRLNNKECKIPDKFEEDKLRKLLAESIAFCRFELLHQSVAIGKEDEVDPQTLKRSLHKLQADELIKFPQNITFKNFFTFTMFPTVVYELVFPRTQRIRKSFLLEKVIAIFGIISIMLFVAEYAIYPLVMRSIELRSNNLNSIDYTAAYVLFVVDMIPPFMVEYLLVFYLIWDAILNAIGELSYYGDRDFYGPWWSCVDWFEYARLWNKPVHRFLLRHVYHSSISAFRLNKSQANLVTFVISSFIHELVMYAIFQRLRGYLWLFQMSQIPLVMISRTNYLRDKKVLGNAICWIGFTSGPAIICTLYLIF
uniref:O-acyltransferase n=1 Tax=Candidozyma auris TaxID=498019 RepID=A0A0L0NN94_CANAR